jgi:hypothetical protein
MFTPLIDHLARARRHELLDASARRRLGYDRVGAELRGGAKLRAGAELRPRRRPAAPLALVNGPRRLISALLRRGARLATQVAARIEPQPMAPPRM